MYQLHPGSIDIFTSTKQAMGYMKQRQFDEAVPNFALFRSFSADLSSTHLLHLSVATRFNAFLGVTRDHC